MTVTTTGLAVVLAALMLLLVRLGAVRPLGLVVCVAFGIVLTLTPIGPDLTSTLSQAAGSVWSQVVSL
jgi:hypothetical protein